MTTMPLAAQQRMRDDNHRLGDLLIAGDAPVGEPGRQMRAVARHLLDYRTWRSLVMQQELTDPEAVEIGVRLLTVMSAPPGTPRASGAAAGSPAAW